MSVRPPAVAGSFYPASRRALAALVDSLLAAAAPTYGPPPKALVVPHAGYVYSGPIAATAYARLRGDTRRKVALLGPSHFAALQGLATTSADEWSTPLGSVHVDPAPDGVAVDDFVHEREHALEVQLPFLQSVLRSDMAVVPIAVGQGPPSDAADLLEPLWLDDATVIVCSTDLSHYHDAATARRLDRRTADAVVAGDVGVIGPSGACGAFALRALLTLAVRHGADVTLLDLRTSADTAGDPSGVVGYGAFAVQLRAG
jgi:AmmeMemoRadiSam system protein B